MILPAANGPYEIPPHVRSGLYAKYASYGRGIDVDKQIALMALWLEKNPSRRPKNPIKFMENWFKKIQDDTRRPPMTWAPDLKHVKRPGPKLPDINGAAAPVPLPAHKPDGTPPVLSLVNAAAPPTIRSANGPRSLSDVLAPFKEQLKRSAR